jgi:hypothetical protein
VINLEKKSPEVKNKGYSSPKEKKQIDFQERVYHSPILDKKKDNAEFYSP